MSSWVEKSARKDALILRDGPELCANLKLHLRQAVEDYTRIYTPPGEIEVQYANCSQITDNCVRIRVIAPPAKENASLEIIFDLEKASVSWGNTTLQIVADDNDLVVLQNGDKSFELEEISQKILKPLFDKLPRRRPNIVLRNG